MSGSAAFAASRPGQGVQALAARGRALAAWWEAGARATVPPRWIAAWTGARRPTLVLCEAGGGTLSEAGGTFSEAGGAWTCLRIEAGRAEPLDFGPAGFTLGGLAEWLAGQDLARDDLRLAVALARDDLFLRMMTLPEAALPQLDTILAQEVARRTPFAPGEIFHGGEVVPGSGPLRSVRHWIVRRDFVGRRLASLGLDAAAVDAVAVAGEDGVPRPVISLRPAGRADDRRRDGRLLKRLGAAALLATVLALAGVDTLEGLRADRAAEALAQARRDAGAGPGGPTLRALLSIKAVPGLGTAWAELSRILPDDTYLTELRLDDGSFAIRGLSGNAAALVRVVDASPLFAAAALTGGIEPNAGAGRDQFGLAFDLRARPPRKGRAPSAGLSR